MAAQNRTPRALVALATLALLASTASVSVAREVPINIEGCPSQLSLTVPSEFSSAVTAEQRAQRSVLIEGLHRNPGRKARYSDVLFTDWDAETRFPQILVASLGSTLQSQGRYTQTQWQEIKRTAVTSSKAQQEEWARRGLARLKPGMPANLKQVEGRVTRLAEGGANDFVAFMDSTATVDGKSVRLYSAAKFNYANQCLAYVTVSVDASDAGALERLVRFAERISVR